MLGWATTALLAMSVSAPAPAPPGPAQILTVPPELHAQLQDQVVRKSRSDQKRLQLLIGFIFDKQGLALQYDASQTRTITEVFESRKANCLSFTMLFVALAREAGLDAHAQEVGQVLSWYQDANTFYDAGHINVDIQLGGQHRTVDLDRSVLYARNGPKPMSRQRTLAHFYNNRGSELMAVGQMAPARGHFGAALALDPDMVRAWNNLGVLESRTGDISAAERAYQTALKLDRSHAPTLSNLVTLYRRRDDATHAAIYLKRLQRVQLGDPFLQFILANESERRGDYRDAAVHYRRAIRLYGKAHQFHFGLARTYLMLGDERGARRELARAQALGTDDAVRDRYQAKLESLRRWEANTLRH